MNIVVVFTPFQAIAARRALDSGVLAGDTRLFCFLRDADWVRMLLGNEAEFLCGNSVFDSLRGLRYFKKTFDNIVATTDEVTAVFAHPFHPAANLLMFSSAVTKRYMLPEGIANYYHCEVDSMIRRQMLVRRAACALVGIPYHLYSGHLTGFELCHFEGVFTFHEEGMVTQGNNVFSLVFNLSGNESAPTPSILVLDQDIESIMPKKKSKELRARLMQYIKSLDAEVVYYKGHYAQGIRELRISEKKIIELDRDVPVELLLSKLVPTYIVSFVSSGLIHAKLIMPQIQATSIGANDIELFIGNAAQGLVDMLELFKIKQI